MQKECQSCHAVKNLDEFHVRTKALDGRQTRCKDCNKEQRKAYYKTAHGKDKNVSAGKRNNVLHKHKIFEYLQTHPCVDCGESDIVVLEFDHIDPSTKTFNIGGSGARFGWNTILAEIAKCEVRCANCHRRRTAKQFGYMSFTFGQPL